MLDEKEILKKALAKSSYQREAVQRCFFALVKSITLDKKNLKGKVDMAKLCSSPDGVLALSYLERYQGGKDGPDPKSDES